MASSVKYLSILAIVLSVVGTTYAVHCYNCESTNNPKCGEKFEPEDQFKFDCSRMTIPGFLQTIIGLRNATGCVKTTSEGVGGGVPIIKRSCYWGDISNTDVGCRTNPALPFIKQLSCHACTGDYCNSSTATGPIAGAIALFFILARMMS